MWFIWTFLACSGAPEKDAAIAIAPLETFSPGMWEQRALTIQSGLQEALALSEADEKQEAHDLVEAIYTGSFEPELEPVIRAHLGRRVALELEYEFAKMLRAIQHRREQVGVRTFNRTNMSVEYSHVTQPALNWELVNIYTWYVHTKSNEISSNVYHFGTE